MPLKGPLDVLRDEMLGDDKKPSSRLKGPPKETVTPTANPLPGRSPDDPLPLRALRKVDDFMRAAANSATFGLADKFAGAMGEQDTEQKTANARAESPYVSLAGDVAGLVAPGGVASKVVSKAVPSLAINTIPRIMGREAVAGAGLSAVDDVIRGNGVDPIKAGISAGAGGLLAGAATGIGRIISPSARVRASDPKIDPTDVANATKLADEAAGVGIPLTGPEAVTAVAPGRAGTLNAAYEAAAASPRGSIAAANFAADRAPKIAQAGQDMAAAISPGIPPQVASRSAASAIADIKNTGQAAAKPYYDAAQGTKVPGINFFKSQAYKEAEDMVLNDAVKIAEFPKNKNGEVNRRSLEFIDAVKKQLDTNYAAAEGKSDAFRTKIIARDTDQVLGILDKASPDYAAGRQVAQHGIQQVQDAEVGPLGRIADNPGNTGAQGDALFNATNDAEKMMAEEAANKLGDATTRGILANRIESAVSTDPLSFGKRVFPTDQSVDLTKRALGPQYDSVDTVIRAARAVNPAGRKPNVDNFGGPIDEAWRRLRDIGKGKVVDLMNDPEWLKKIGTLGPVNSGVIRAGTASGILAADEATNGRRKRKPLRIDVTRYGPE